MALFDFPWMPLSTWAFASCSIVWIGVAATMGGLISVFLTYLTECGPAAQPRPR